MNYYRRPKSEITDPIIGIFPLNYTDKTTEFMNRRRNTQPLW